MMFLQHGGEEKNYDGYKGIDEQGRQFELHWNHFPDDSSTPNWMWSRTDVPEVWVDLTQGMDLPPKLPTYFLDKNILGYCSTHKRLFYLAESNECFYCKFHKENPGYRDIAAEQIKQIEEENRIWREW